MEKNGLTNRLRNFFKNKYNALFSLVMLGAIIIRVYYFFITKTQTVWWDEASYLSTAIHWAFKLHYQLNPQRPPLLPFLESLILSIGGGEVLIRFFLLFLPSIGIVILTYLVGKEMYDRKVGLIASVIMAVFWPVLFNTFRLHVEVLLLFFIYLGIYLFWKGYIKKEKRVYIWFFGVALALAFLTKYTTFLIGLVFFLFLIVIERFRFLKNRDLWLSILFFFIIMIPYFIWSYISFKTLFPFLTAGGRGDVGRSLIESSKEIFGYVPFFLGKILLVIFFIGFIILLIKLILGFDILLKKSNIRMRSDLFNLLFIVVFLFYFIFIMRGAEDRWVLPIALPLLLIMGKGFSFLFDFIKKYNKYIALVVIIILLSIGAYWQIKQADSIINIKKDTYLQVKEAALWMKENSNKEDVIFSISLPQTTYYSERKAFTYSDLDGEEEFESKINELKPTFLTISIFEPHPDYALNYINSHQDRFQVVHGYFADNERKQPILIIYRIIY